MDNASLKVYCKQKVSFSLKAVCHACLKNRLGVGYFPVFQAAPIKHLLVLPADLQW